MRALSRLAVVLLCAASLAACSGEAQVAPVPPDQRDVAPAFRLPGLDGGRVALAEYRGRRVLINFWASYCGPCREEMPALQQFSTAQDDVAVLGIAVNDDPADSREFARDVRVSFPLAIDRQADVISEYGGSALPMTVVVDAQGRVANTFFGPLTRADLDRIAGSP